MECFDTGAVFSVQNSNAWWCLYASCNGTEATENNKYTRVQLFYSRYVHRYIFIYIYVHKYSERERERTKTLYQTIKVQYMSGVRKMDGFPLISSLLNQVQKILAGWHRSANSKPSTGFSAPSAAQRLPSSENPQKIAAWKWRAGNLKAATFPGNFPNTSAAHRHPPPLSSRS